MSEEYKSIQEIAKELGVDLSKLKNTGEIDDCVLKPYYRAQIMSQLQAPEKE